MLLLGWKVLRNGVFFYKGFLEVIGIELEIVMGILKMFLFFFYFEIILFVFVGFFLVYFFRFFMMMYDR